VPGATPRLAIRGWIGHLVNLTIWMMAARQGLKKGAYGNLFLSESSAGACCHRHHLVVGFTWIEGRGEELPP
jgi:hypothetical protein